MQKPVKMMQFCYVSHSDQQIMDTNSINLFETYMKYAYVLMFRCEPLVCLAIIGQLARHYGVQHFSDSYSDKV